MRKQSKSVLKAATLSGLLAFMAIMTTPTPIAFQDAASFAGKTLTHDRWLAALIVAPGHFVHGADLPQRGVPVILSANGKRLQELDLRQSGDLKGVIFATTPSMARHLSRQTVVSRQGKGDRPILQLKKKQPGTVVRSLYDDSALYQAPNAVLWPASRLRAPTPLKVATSIKAERLQRDEKTAGTIKAPLPLIPVAALAAIEVEAEAKARQEIDQITTASVGLAGLGPQAYAGLSDDPRSIFEAILARRNGTATLPEAPQNVIREIAETPLDAALSEETAFPLPRLKPEVVETLDIDQATLNKKQHFWAAFQLPGSVYKKAQQRCLAAAIYFESRGEIEEGQAAVAQVVLNRVKNPAYPDTICGVVYQNKNWRNRCQFSFACDGIYDRVTDKEAWERAVRIARDVSKGKIYLDKVADSTHYHATYVKPDWRREMKVVDRIGVHIFYRTKNGGWS